MFQIKCSAPSRTIVIRPKIGSNSLQWSIRPQVTVLEIRYRSVELESVWLGFFWSAISKRLCKAELSAAQLIGGIGVQCTIITASFSVRLALTGSVWLFFSFSFTILRLWEGGWSEVSFGFPFRLHSIAVARAVNYTDFVVCLRTRAQMESCSMIHLNRFVYRLKWEKNENHTYWFMQNFLERNGFMFSRVCKGQKPYQNKIILYFKPICITSSSRCRC